MLMSCAEPAPVIGRVFDLGSSDMEFLLLQVCTVDLFDDTDDIIQARVWNVLVSHTCNCSSYQRCSTRKKISKPSATAREHWSSSG